MNRHRTTFLGLAASVLMVTLSACSSTATRQNTLDAAGESAIAGNLILALAQVPSLNPFTNTVQMAPPTSSFGVQVQRLLAEAGYGIQTVEGDTGEFFVRYREETIRSELGEETSFLVAIGDISAERSFDTAKQSRPVPLSPIYIAGVPEFDIRIDDGAFVQSGSDMTYALFDQAALPQVFDFDTQTSSTVQQPERAIVISGAPGSDGTEQAPVESDTTLRNAVKQNIYHTDQSNYADVFAAYEDVRQEVLVFGNDSMRLGNTNKRTVQEFADAFDPSTDLLSIIGCSHGNTAVANGNAVLAVGRANRVKEAFLFAGIDSEKVLEEGCWNGEYHETMPRRGVLLTLKRLAT